jgi:hypothetical protein
MSVMSASQRSAHMHTCTHTHTHTHTLILPGPWASQLPPEFCASNPMRSCEDRPALPMSKRGSVPLIALPPRRLLKAPLSDSRLACRSIDKPIRPVFAPN